MIRHITFGEGDYDGTEKLIRQLLDQAKAGAALPPATQVAAVQVSANQTPESYIGYEHGQADTSGDAARPRQADDVRDAATIKPDTFALAGQWTVAARRPRPATGPSSPSTTRPRTSTSSSEVRAPWAFRSTVARLVPSQVTGAPTLYTMVKGLDAQRARLDLTFSPGVQAYSFTFG